METQTPQNPKIDHDRRILQEADANGGMARLLSYIRLSGPGWLQSAITLGGGSLSTSLFLGVLGGVSLLWIQPLAMMLGIIMLCAISYMALSTGQRPFGLVRKHVNPVIAWGWIIATVLANIIWSLPQFSLGTAAVTSNLIPGANPVMVSLVMLAVSVLIIWFYDSGSRGIRIFENLLKLIVALIVLSFVGVVVKMAGTGGSLDWSAIAGGFIPDFSQLTQPAPSFAASLQGLETGAYSFWSELIVSQQRGVIFSGVTYAVGINMTFLLPYSQLAKGWDKDFRGLAAFDLSTSLLVPFMIATSCIVIAASSQFHTVPEEGLITEVNAAGEIVLVDSETKNTALAGTYAGLLDQRLASAGVDTASMSETERELARASLPMEDKQLAAMLVKRGALTLASSLEPLMGKVFANYVFGFGVFAMTLSSIIILMLINGFALCEMLGLPDKGVWHRFGCMLPGIGVLGPLVWKEASFWVVVPTATIGLVALPLAYLSFFALFNNKELLGEERVEGGKRTVLNVLMVAAILFVSFGCIWAAYDKAGNVGLLGIAIFLAMVVVAHFRRNKASS
ncbi:divalent metal cation transporter [Pelagicoccus mobilis]|uniref:Divalent metal cation transporter n=1 Tax=Pelagicoccus mobilis TaxID=415221 RepID=A0A934VPK6_9BACT|nr:divalent metal cation transporter [Pelagicoccus mobilis]MBK1875915.1 divalent metal cation transporter [Pelagicoccus mobilis]